MMKSEFEDRIGKKITPATWEIVQTVYAFHPRIKHVGGKDQIAAIYKNDGMSQIEDMFYRSERIQSLEAGLGLAGNALLAKERAMKEEKDIAKQEYLDILHAINAKYLTTISEIKENIEKDHKALDALNNWK
jgi:hypothetical protein